MTRMHPSKHKPEKTTKSTSTQLHHDFFAGQPYLGSLFSPGGWSGIFSVSDMLDRLECEKDTN